MSVFAQILPSQSVCSLDVCCHFCSVPYASKKEETYVFLMQLEITVKTAVHGREKLAQLTQRDA